MKFRDGIFVVCPYCQSARMWSGVGPDRVFYQCTDLKNSRYHKFSCGCSILEAEMDKDIRNNMFCSVESVCPGAVVALSKGLYAVMNKYDLWTMTTFQQTEQHAIALGNITSSAIHDAIRNSSMMQDNWRLPPIPNLPSHIKLLARKNLPE
jgi:hypothetical protein